MMRRSKEAAGPRRPETPSWLAGAMIGLTWPSSSEWAIGTLIGCSMLFAGISRLSLSLAARRIVAHLP